MSTICLGMLLGLTHLGMAGWGVFIAPNTNLAVGEKLCSLRHTGQCTVHCPMRLVVGLTLQPTVGVQAFYTGHSGLHTGQCTVHCPFLCHVICFVDFSAMYRRCILGMNRRWHRIVTGMLSCLFCPSPESTFMNLDDLHFG
jgi:hypothetical protein